MEVPHSIVMTVNNCVIQSDLNGSAATGAGKRAT